MITSLNIATHVYKLLKSSPIAKEITGKICYQRADYSKEDIVIIPCSITGEGSLRYSQININLHVPDIITQNGTKANFTRLDNLTTQVVDLLRTCYVAKDNYSWKIGFIDAPYSEPGLNEHFVNIKLEIVARRSKTPSLLGSVRFNFS